MNGSNIAAIIITILLVLGVAAFFIYCFIDPKQLRRCYKCFKKSLPFSRFEDEDEETGNNRVRFQNDHISGNVFDEDQPNINGESHVQVEVPNILSIPHDDVQPHLSSPDSTSNGGSPLAIVT